jgi:pyruvate dehydrogenase E2 component (dihydrolipoamide acetyltransferase)
METGVIEKWHKKEGDTVNTGDVLFEVMTDKVSLEVEAYNSGILKKILKKEGDEVPVTEVIAYIGQADEEVPQAAGVTIQSETKAEKVPEGAAVKVEGNVSVQPEKNEPRDIISEIETIKISPLAKNLAKAKGIDITRIQGSGPGGRIVKEDIESFASVAKPSQADTAVIQVSETALTDISEPQRIKISPLARNVAAELGVDYKSAKIKGTGPEGRIVKEDILAFVESLKKQPVQAVQAARVSHAAVSAVMAPPKVKSSETIRGMRKVIAERLTYSKQNIPHIIISSVMDVTSLIALREKIKDKVLENYGVKLTYTDFIIKAAAIVLAKKPVINASLQDSNHIIYDDVNVGLAVSVEEGLIVPTIYSADKLSLFEIAARRMELVGKAKASKLTLAEISNGTFTISNLGMYGVRNFTAIINPPQGAILMVNEIYKAPVVINDKIEIRSQMEMSIAVDHRIIDGAEGAKYLLRLREILENPELLLI